MTSGLQPIEAVDDAIDLRGAILTVLRFWPLLIIMTLLTAGVTYAMSSGGRPMYEARAGIVVTTTRVEMELEPRIRIVSDDNATAQRQAFAGLVRNPAIAERVLAALGAETLPEGLRDVAALTRLVSAQLGQLGLIEIRVVYHDPAVAARIANAWGQEYERYVNALYNAPVVALADIANQVQRAEAEYAQAQQALSDFTAENSIAELARRIGTQESVIQNLQAAERTAVATVVSDTLRSRIGVVRAYLDAQSEAVLLAMAQDRQARLSIYNRLTRAESQALEAIFGQQFSERINRLDGAFAEKARLEGLLANARALESQIAAAGESATQSNTLALLLLKAQVFASSGALPANLQLNVDTAGGAPIAAESQRQDVAALIGVVEARLQQLDVDVQAQMTSLLTGEGYVLLDAIRASGLTVAAPLAVTPGEEANGPLPAAGPVTTLADAVLRSYFGLLDVGDLARLSQSWAADSPLAEALQQLYPQLLDLDALESIIGQPPGTPLDDEFTQVVQALESEVRQLQSQLEQERARQRELVSARDRAWEAYDTLARKSAEVDITSATANSVVRFALPALEPDRPIGSRRLLFTLLAGGLGLVLAAGLALLVNYLNPDFARRVTVGGRR